MSNMTCRHERYIQLARVFREAQPKIAAEYAKTAINMIPSEFVVISAPSYTTTSNLRSYHKDFAVLDSKGALADQEDLTRAIRDEFADLSVYWSSLDALVGGHTIALSNGAEEGLAIWQEFLTSVLLRQEVIRPLSFTPESLLDNPADVIGKYEDVSADTDYISGFRAAAITAVRGNPWFLSSQALAAAALLGPVELIRTRMPASEFLSLQATDPIAPDERLRRLAALGETEKVSSAGEWFELAQDVNSGYWGHMLFNRTGCRQT